MSAKRGARLLGPYEERAGWRVLEIDAQGNRSRIMFPTEAKALRFMMTMQAELAREDHTTATALEEYKRHLTTIGRKAESVDVAEWAVLLFFPEPQPLALLPGKRCQALYDEIRTRPSKATGQPLAADTHRGALARIKAFFAWCVERGWIRANPAADVKAIGKLRPRGKSLGKSGAELRVKQARAFYAKALELANAGDEGATAALVALLLGCRASEIVGRRVADLDEDQAPADLFHVPASKTPAGRRTLEVPEVLRPLLAACAEYKAPERYLFEARPDKDKSGARKPHDRGWVIDQVHRICDAAQVPRVTAHAMRGLLASIAAERGIAGHLLASHLGHADERITIKAYQAPGSAAAGARRRGWAVLDGGAAALESGSGG